MNERERALDEEGRLTPEAPSLAWRLQMDFDYMEVVGVSVCGGGMGRSRTKLEEAPRR